MIKKYYLGIDGGGTKTELLLCDENGKECRRLLAGASNPNDIGMETCKSVIRDAVAEILREVPYSSVKVFAGLAGAVTGENKCVLESFFSEFGFEKFAVGADIENIISLGLDNEDGIAVIMGTGLGTFKVVDGKSIKVASLGYLFEDGGSGYGIGRDGLKAHFLSLDHLEEKTLITNEIEKRSDYNKNGLLSEVYKGGKRYIASFAKEVFNALSSGDKIAKEIVENNMKIVYNLIDKIASTMTTNIKIVFAGGITNNEYAMNYLFNDLGVKNKYRVEVLTKTPIVDGAIKLARKL